MEDKITGHEARPFITDGNGNKSRTPHAYIRQCFTLKCAVKAAPFDNRLFYPNATALGYTPGRSRNK